MWFSSQFYGYAQSKWWLEFNNEEALGCALEFLELKPALWFADQKYTAGTWLCI